MLILVVIPRITTKINIFLISESGLMVDIYLQGAGFSWKTSEMSVSDNADVV